MNRHGLSAAVRRIALFLVGGGCVALGFCAALMADAWIAQRRAGIDLQKRIQAAGPHERAERGDAIGRIEIARLGISSIIMEGSDETTLRRGVGHIFGTALPGHSGNVGLAGHRDTFFRALRNVRRSDTIILRTPRGEYFYRVISTKTVVPAAVDVLLPTPDESVTLVTCFPFNYVGAAPERFIVRAAREGTGRASPSLR
jgi:sortase A